MNRRSLLKSILAVAPAPALRFLPAPQAPKLEHVRPTAKMISLLREHYLAHLRYELHRSATLAPHILPRDIDHDEHIACLRDIHLPIPTRPGS